MRGGKLVGLLRFVERHKIKKRGIESNEYITSVCGPDIFKPNTRTRSVYSILPIADRVAGNSSIERHGTAEHYLGTMRAMEFLRGMPIEQLGTHDSSYNYGDDCNDPITEGMATSG